MLTHGSSSLIQSCAVIGGGFSGLAASNFLLNQLPHCQVTLYDTEAIPGYRGASAAAGGLMHPFTPKGKLIWKGLEGFTESENLIKSCQLYSKEIISKITPILRPCTTQEDYLQWQETANKYPELLETYNKEQVISITGHNDNVLGGAMFKKALVIDSPLYLKALWNRVMSLSPQSKWISRRIQTSDDMKYLSQNHDVVIIAAGPSMQLLYDSWNSDSNNDMKITSPKQLLPFKYVRGQNLYFEKRSQQQVTTSNTVPDCNQGPTSDNINTTHSNNNTQKDYLKVPLLKGEYLVPIIHQHQQQNNDYNTSSFPTLIGGATHEYAISLHELSYQPNQSQAESLLLSKLQVLYPQLLHDYKVIGSNAGIRVMTERSNLGKIPVIARFPVNVGAVAVDNNNCNNNSNVWLMGGLGARGLIHHAYVAKILVQAIINDKDGVDDSNIPKELRLIV